MVWNADDVAGERLVERFALLRKEEDRRRDVHRLLLAHIEQLHAALEFARAQPHERDPVAVVRVHVGLHLEDKAGDCFLPPDRRRASSPCVAARRAPTAPGNRATRQRRNPLARSRRSPARDALQGKPSRRTAAGRSGRARGFPAPAARCVVRYPHADAGPEWCRAVRRARTNRCAPPSATAASRPRYREGRGNRPPCRPARSAA